MRLISASLVCLALGNFSVPMLAADNPKGCMVQLPDSTLPKNKRLFIFGLKELTAKGEDGTYLWTYLPDGPEHATFNPNNGPNYRKTTMTALDFPTQKPDEDKVRVRLTKSDGSVCNDLKAINLTHPRYFVLDSTFDNLPPKPGEPPHVPNHKPTPAIQSLTDFTQGAPADAVVMDTFIRYNIFDQLHTIITDSDRGGKHTETKEAVVIKGFLGTKWKPPRTQPGYGINDDGFQSDQLTIVAILASFRGNNGLFRRELINQTVATFNMTHDWYTSVSQKHEQKVTANTVSIVVTGIDNQDRDIHFKTIYTVIPQ